jgi:hypothetical protein
MDNIKLDIIPTDCAGLDCVDGLVISVAEWLHRKYKLVFAEAWNFQFADEIEEYPHTIGGRLFIPNVVDQEILKACCGIEVNYNKINNAEQLISILKEEVSKQRPVIIIYDMFWCPWSNAFQKNHKPDHASLVIGYNESGLNCIDYSPRCEGSILPYEYLNKSIKAFYTINIQQTIANDNFDWHEIVNKSISSINNYDTFNTIRNFGTYIKESFDPIKEMNRYGIDKFDSNPLSWQIGRISESRRLFASTLRYLHERYNINQLLLLAEKLEAAVPMWSTIISLIIKSCISSNLNLLERISKKIYEVADFEETIFKCLEAVNKDPLYELDLFSDYTPNISSLSLQYVNLTKYCNCRAFESGQDPAILPDFTGDGAFILKDELVCKEEVGVDNLKFKLTNLLTDSCDNILCKGQTIEIENGKFKKIMFLGCSTLGSYSGDVKVNYANGSFESIKIDLSDCYPYSVAFEQKVIWGGNCSIDYKKRTKGFGCQLYAESYDLNYLNDIKSITLPLCPNMHIFAISLGS